MVFDADVSLRNDKERQMVERMKNKYANNKGVLFCDSLPSIEYWFLLHYKDAGRLFKTSNEVVEEIKEYNSQFDKSEKFLKNDSWVRQLCEGERLKQAIERCNFVHRPIRMKWGLMPCRCTASGGATGGGSALFRKWGWGQRVVCLV